MSGEEIDLAVMREEIEYAVASLRLPRLPDDIANVIAPLFAARYDSGAAAAPSAPWSRHVVPSLVDALRAVLDLCDHWDRSPGTSSGLKMGQMTHGCASYWIREAIADALVSS